MRGRRLLLNMLSILLFMSVSGQEMNQTRMDTGRAELFLIGYCNRDGIEHGLMAEDFQFQYSAYPLVEELVSNYADQLISMDISIVFGSWCSDSREQLPRFFRILDAAGYPSERLMLLAVDHSKTAPDIDITKLRIERVPSFIFYLDGREVGRIVETPIETLEADISTIMNGIKR